MLRLGRQRVLDSGAPPPAWNAADFSVVYPSLASHLAVGGVYLKLLLEGADASGVEKLADPRGFFTAAHLHFLRRGDASGATPSTAGAAGGPSSSWGGNPALERELCVRAMAATYAAHAAAIGPFEEGMPHVIELLDATASRPLRHHLLGLIQALVSPRGASPSSAPGRDGAGGASPEALRAAQANAAALVAAGGAEILVGVVAAAHEASERPAAALQSNLISASSHADEVHVWCYLPAAAGAPPVGGTGGGAGEVTAFFDQYRRGPISKAEIRQLAARGEITPATLFWAPGMPEPAALRAIRELRWWTAGGQAPLTPFQAAETALRVLSSVVALRPATDARGEAVIPLPPAHRQLASPRCLPHIAQVALTGEPALVAAAAVLLLDVTRHNGEAMGGMYRTGVFFFLLAYCGSNLLEVARLFQAAHLRQHSRAGADVGPASPLAARSYLGALLPGKFPFICFV